MKYIPLLALMLICNCTDQFDDGIPAAFFDKTINLNNIENADLRFPGGKILYSSGVRGLIIIRQSTDQFLIIERNCTYEPLSTNSIVDIDVSSLFLIDHSCESSFDLNGFPIGGPATLPLRVYFSKRTGDFLRISSEPIN